MPELLGDDGSGLFPRIVGRLSDAEGPRDVDGELGATWGREELGGDCTRGVEGEEGDCTRGLDGAERDGEGDWILGVEGVDERALGELERLLLGALR